MTQLCSQRREFDHSCIQKLVSDLSFAIGCNLTHTRDGIEERLTNFLERFSWGFGDAECFKLQTIQLLLESIAPFQAVNDENNPVDSSPPKKKQKRCLSSVRPSNCNAIWNQICSCLDFALLSINVMSDTNGFAQLVYYSLQSYHKRMKLERDNISLKLSDHDGPCYVQIITGSGRTRIKRAEIGKSIDIDAAVSKEIFDTSAEKGCHERKLKLKQS
jgi:hypothetical protein